MRVLITGSTGFIGGHLIRRLAGTPHELRCLVRDPGGRGARALACRGAEVVAGDVTDPDAVRRAVAGCDAVVHLANIYSFWERDPRVFDAVNVRGTGSVMDAALAAGVSRVVHLSTVEALDSAPGPRPGAACRSWCSIPGRCWGAATANPRGATSATSRGGACRSRCAPAPCSPWCTCATWWRRSCGRSRAPRWWGSATSWACTRCR